MDALFGQTSSGIRGTRFSLQTRLFLCLLLVAALVAWYTLGQQVELSANLTPPELRVTAGNVEIPTVPLGSEIQRQGRWILSATFLGPQREGLSVLAAGTHVRVRVRGSAKDRVEVVKATTGGYQPVGLLPEEGLIAPEEPGVHTYRGEIHWERDGDVSGSSPTGSPSKYGESPCCP